MIDNRMITKGYLSKNYRKIIDTKLENKIATIFGENDLQRCRELLFEARFIETSIIGTFLRFLVVKLVRDSAASETFQLRTHIVYKIVCLATCCCPRLNTVEFHRFRLHRRKPLQRKIVFERKCGRIMDISERNGKDGCNKSIFVGSCSSFSYRDLRKYAV